MMWDPGVGNVEHRLPLWKMKVLSWGNKITLINATLSNRPEYYMSLLMLVAVSVK